MSNSLRISIWHKAFGKNRYVMHCPTHNMTQEDINEKRYDEVLWVERPNECEYALMSPRLKTKKVVLVYREAWIHGFE